MEGMASKTWNLSKNLQRRIFRLKILHRQFHLISTVLVGKNTKKWVKMEKFTPLAKILHCRRYWRHGQIPPLHKQYIVMLQIWPGYRTNMEGNMTEIWYFTFLAADTQSLRHHTLTNNASHCYLRRSISAFAKKEIAKSLSWDEGVI